MSELQKESFLQCSFGDLLEVFSLQVRQRRVERNERC